MINSRDLTRKAQEEWCAGKGGKVCGYYNLRKQFLSALSDYMNKHNLSKEDVIGVSGIGCSGRFTTWQDVVTVHTTHGNAPNLAQGISLIREINDKKSLIYIVSGDGDALAIGRSNFENLCHINANVTYLILNNGIYAMTSGQTAPTTHYGVKTVSAPYGNLEAPWDALSIALDSGATFVARVSSYHKESNMLKSILTEAFEHKGMSVVEVISFCPTQNPDNKGRPPSEVEKEYFKNSIDIDKVKMPKFKGVDSRLRYALAKDRLSRKNKEVLIKGVVYKFKGEGYSQLTLEQKAELGKKFGGKSLSEKIEVILKDKKIISLQ